MFSCRPRVELVAAGSRSPCVCNVGMQVRPQKSRPAAPSPAGQSLPMQTHKLEVFEESCSRSSEVLLPPQAPCPRRT